MWSIAYLSPTELCVILDVVYLLCCCTWCEWVILRGVQVLKTAILAEKFASNYSWYVDVILQLISHAGDFVSDDIWFRVVQIVTNHEDIQEYAANMVFKVNIIHSRTLRELIYHRHFNNQAVMKLQWKLEDTFSVNLDIWLLRRVVRGECPIFDIWHVTCADDVVLDPEHNMKLYIQSFLTVVIQPKHCFSPLMLNL